MPTANEIYDEATKIKDSGDLPGAIAKLQEALAVDPSHTDTHAALAVYYQRLHQPEPAIEHAKKVVELMPDDVFAYTQLSVIYMRCGKILEAEDAKAKAQMLAGHRH